MNTHTPALPWGAGSRGSIWMPFATFSLMDTTLNSNEESNDTMMTRRDDRLVIFFFTFFFFVFCVFRLDQVRSL